MRPPPQTTRCAVWSTALRRSYTTIGFLGESSAGGVSIASSSAALSSTRSVWSSVGLCVFASTMTAERLVLR